MKKVILVSLFTLLAGTSAFGAYAVSGLVKDESGALVSGATVYINCYPAAGGSYSDTDTSNALGVYSGGWPDKNCDEQKMVVKAVKGAKSGSVTWNASGVADIKNITIRAPMIATSAELHCEPEPVLMSEPITQPSTVMLYAQLTAPGPILVHGGTADMHYETETMSCYSVAPNPPFDSFFDVYIDPVAGTIHVEAYAPPGLYVPVENGENPTPFFTLVLEGHSNTPGKISNVTVTSSEIELDGGTTTGTFPSRTEYVIGEPNDKCKPFFRLDTQLDWEEALSGGHVYAMEPEDWEYYMFQWQQFAEEGEPYPDDPFLPAAPPTGELYVYGGGGGGGAEPCDAGLVMYWGDATTPDGAYSSAHKFDYLMDPDLSNCIITVAVTAPQFSPITGAQINKVSFGLQNPPMPGGSIRAWYWNCGAAGSGAPITWNTPTVITIDTSKTGVGAATPVASAYMNNPGFTLKNVQWLIVDEDANWVGGGTPAPAPGTGMIGMWNYWHWLMVSPKTTLAKGYYPKWSQPPVVIDPNTTPPTILGWDERSLFGDQTPHVVADDWECNDDRPITDIHWWGSFIGWNQPKPPPVTPQAFHIGIWTDVPDPDPCNPDDFSHPGELIWENYCDNYVWNFAGYDRDPRIPEGADPCELQDSCFQFNQLLSQDEWFYQEPSDDPCRPRIYWLSIAPVWGSVTPPYEWGWKTRPHYFNDDAVVITDVTILPPVIGTKWTGGYPIQWPPWPDPEGITWDVAFELTTNEPGPPEPPSADLNNDGIVDFFDFAIFANQWLTAGP